MQELKKAMTIYVRVENDTGEAPDTVISVHARRGQDEHERLIADQEKLLNDPEARAVIALLLRKGAALVDKESDLELPPGKKDSVYSLLEHVLSMYASGQIESIAFATIGPDGIPTFGNANATYSLLGAMDQAKMALGSRLLREASDIPGFEPEDIGH